MDRFHTSLFRAAVASIGFGLTICVAAADTSSSADIEAALARGDAALDASQYATAEAAYKEAQQLAERQGGSQSELVLTPLLGLGKTFVATGHHDEAVPLLQRAVSIARKQYGVFSPRQQDALKTLAASLTAVRRVPEAQDLMIYRARVAEKTYGEGNPKVIPALCDLGNWFSEVGKSAEALMTFQTALNIVGAKDALNDPIIVEPLRGIARTYMRRKSYPEAWLYPPSPPGCSAPGQECGWPFRMDSSGKRIVLSNELTREGEEALKRALRILDADPSASTPTLRIETLLQMGDWYQIKKSPREALPYYQRAWQLIGATPKLPSSVATALTVPLRVYYPTPGIVAHVPTVQPEAARSHHVQMEFTVAADGSVSDARIVDHDTRDRYARDVLEAVRASRFRPKFVDGQPVATPGISYREVFWTGKTPE